MKRLTLLLLVLCLSLCSCLQPEQPSNDGDGAPDPAPFSAEEAANAFLTEGRIVDCSRREYSYSEMLEDLQALKEQHPTRLSLREIGTSLDGRAIPLAILGNPSAQRQILVSAGIHGREYLTPLLVMKQLEFYLTYYDTGSFDGTSYSTLFDSCAFYVVPMSNPDGIMLSQEGLSSVRSEELREKIQGIYEADKRDGMTSQVQIDSYLQYWKANANGVDLNRNFDALWKEYSNISRSCHAQYKGPFAASEPETQALVSLVEELDDLCAVLCIHSQGEVLYWNCGQTGSLYSETLSLTQTVADGNGYEIVFDQNNDASFSDWCALEKGLVAITVETGKGLCPLDTEKFLPIWEDNYDLLARSAAHFQK